MATLRYREWAAQATLEKLHCCKIGLKAGDLVTIQELDGNDGRLGHGTN